MLKIKLKSKKIIKLDTSPSVFAPTQTSHYLLSAIKDKIDKKKNLEVIDMGCGNGILGISLLKIFNNINKMIFTDVNIQSLRDCEKNMKKNNLKKKKITN